ncbi:hypothetical protein STEG23_037068, partial [Scotinomys teguina]
MASQQDSGFFEISIKYLLKSWSNDDDEDDDFIIIMFESNYFPNTHVTVNRCPVFRFPFGACGFSPTLGFRPMEITTACWRRSCVISLIKGL